MGNLVDTYIITPKYVIDDKGMKDCIIDRNPNDIVELLTDEKDKELFKSAFINNSFFISDIFKNGEDIPDKLWFLIEEHEKKYPEWAFSRRYREDSFLQRMRETYFKTLMMIQNDYDGCKENHFIVVYSDEVFTVNTIPYYSTTMEEFLNQETDDQKFCKQVVDELTNTTK